MFRYRVSYSNGVREFGNSSLQKCIPNEVDMTNAYDICIYTYERADL
jgi:hypothetical protein